MLDFTPSDRCPAADAYGRHIGGERERELTGVAQEAAGMPLSYDVHWHQLWKVAPAPQIKHQGG
jgi:hypothetical protein